jgi:hypothetical protein
VPSVRYWVDNVIQRRRRNAWINARENVPADRNNRRRSSVAPSVRQNARNAGSKAARTQISRVWFRDRNRVRLSI